MTRDDEQGRNLAAEANAASDAERRDLEAWLAGFRLLSQHPTTGERTEIIRETSPQ